MRRPKRANRFGSTAMSLRASASNSHPMTKSRVKEWLSDRRQGLLVAAGFPMAVPHEPSHSRVTIPFPSHRTCSFPEYGGPTAFITRHAQGRLGIGYACCPCRSYPGHTDAYSDSVAIRNLGLSYDRSDTDESAYC